MKKSQRLRYHALKSKTTRTEAEEQELSTLAALVAQHPDESQDTDDVKPTKGITLSDLTAKITAVVSAKESLVTENRSLAARITELEAGNLGTVTLVAVVAAAGLQVAALAGKDAAAVLAALCASSADAAKTARDQVATLTAERDTAQGALASLATALGFKAGTIAITPEACAAVGITHDEAFQKLTPAEQSAKVARAAFDHAVGAKTAATITELGISPATLPSPQGKSTNETLEELQSAMAGEKDPAKLGVLAAKANKLRDQITPGNN